MLSKGAWRANIWRLSVAAPVYVLWISSLPGGRNKPLPARRMVALRPCWSGSRKEHSTPDRMADEEEKIPYGGWQQSDSRATGTPHRRATRVVAGLVRRARRHTAFGTAGCNGPHPARSSRAFGGLSLGESTHLVDEVKLLCRKQRRGRGGFCLHGPRSIHAARLGRPRWLTGHTLCDRRYCHGTAHRPRRPRLPQILPPEL